MYVLVLIGTIWDGPFNTYLEALRAQEAYAEECGCGCGQTETFTTIKVL